MDGLSASEQAERNRVFMIHLESAERALLREQRKTARYHAHIMLTNYMTEYQILTANLGIRHRVERCMNALGIFTQKES